MKTTPFATIDPPKLGNPVFPFAPSVPPSGTFHAISPLLASTAFSVPHGGFWHGFCCSSQKRAYSPRTLLRRYFSGELSGCGSSAPTAPTSFAFTNKYPRDGSKDPADQFPPPSVPGTTSVCCKPYGVKILPPCNDRNISAQNLLSAADKSISASVN